MHLETRVLITGGAGFLGSHLCERLLKQCANVICVDNYWFRSHPARCYVPALLRNPTQSGH